MAKAGIPTVPTKLLFSINAQGDGVSYPAIVKPIHGSWGGRLVSLVGNAEDLAMILRHKAVGDSYSRIAMIQPFIGDGTDYRVFVIGDEVVASMVRKPSQVIGGVMLPGVGLPTQLGLVLTPMKSPLRL